MIQVFLLTEFFLLYSAALLLSDTYGTHFLSLINLHKFVYSRKSLKIITLISCVALTVCNIYFPLEPGPVLLGDFLPVMTLIVLFLAFAKRFSKDAEFIDIYKKYDIFGYLALVVAVIHFLFPAFVVL